MDNNMDGRSDPLVKEARWPEAPIYETAGLSTGHFLGDRSTISTLNLNELIHPAALFYVGIGRETSNKDRPDNFLTMAVLGKKPLKGYTNWMDERTRWFAADEPENQWGTYAHPESEVEGLTYQSAFWYENQFGDADESHASWSSSQGHVQHNLRTTSRYLHTGNSPVHTAYITAQSLDRYERPLSEVKMMATIERTWDGKINILDFRSDLPN
jgi:hypothetical protein